MVGIVDGSSSSSVVVVIINGWLGGGYRRWALLFASPRPSSSSPSCPSPAISSISPVSSIRIASSSLIHAVRVESRCCGGIASSWLWVFYGSWVVINVSEGERKEGKQPHRLPLLRIISSLLSLIHPLSHQFTFCLVVGFCFIVVGF